MECKEGVHNEEQCGYAEQGGGMPYKPTPQCRARRERWLDWQCDGKMAWTHRQCKYASSEAREVGPT